MFVVDSNDTSRMSVAKEELWRVLHELNEAELPKIPLLVYANKQDVEASMTVAEVRDALDLNLSRGESGTFMGRMHEKKVNTAAK
jgi:signal recognition particle receptor subunit beta